MTRRRRRSGTSVFLAAFLVGVSAAALIWGLEQVAQGGGRAHARSQLRSTLQDARHLLTERGTAASRTASRLASSQTVQNAFLDRSPGPLRALAASSPDVGFVLWDNTTIGRRAVSGVDFTVGVYGGGAYLGRVVVSASPTAKLLDRSRQRHRSVKLWFAVGQRVVVTSPPVSQPDLDRALGSNLHDELALSGTARVVALHEKPHVPFGWFWPLLVGLVGAGVSFELFGRAEDRRRAEPPPNTVRDAVALVGETLAATHNPEALLPVILQAAIEATHASGGSISSGDIVLATRGAPSVGRGEPLEYPLRVAGGRPALLVLHPPSSGFDAEARDAAAWIAAQALIALENAHLHGLVQRQAVTDELTGLANRRRFLAQLDTEVARSRRSGSPLALVLSDLDDFKQVNDRYGHEAGDRTLRAFADILRAAVRDIDLPVRLGGEEFAILLPDTNLEGGANLAERIRATLAATKVESASDHIRVTASFGVSCFPMAAAAEELLVDADRRLYDAKRLGKNRVEVSEANDHAELA